VPDSSASALRQVGLVVHPTRPLTRVLETIATWAPAHGVAVGQVRFPDQEREVAEPVDPAVCDLLIALGGDGTALHALHAGAPASRPVLGIACGSVGVLTSVRADRAAWALEQIVEGRWSRHAIPGLEIAWSEAGAGVAINDLVMVRDGPGQAVVSIAVDDVLYAEVAGDGIVVATALGSSAYSMAAGGPILAPGADAMVVTPLAPHGGCAPPLVAGDASQLAITIEHGYRGIRCELDGRTVVSEGRRVTVRHRRDYAVMVELSDQEPRLTGLRRRGLVLDGPRVLIRASRSADTSS
jgi:NAD+ kinase